MTNDHPDKTGGAPLPRRPAAPGQALAVAVVDCGSGTFPDVVAGLRAAGATTRSLALAVAGRDGAFDGAGGVVVSGGPHLFTDADKGASLAAAFPFLDGLTVPVLGICLGHQAIGLRAGAVPYLGVERRCQESIRLEGKHPLLAGIPDGAEFHEDHTEGIPLPAGFQLLASSRHYLVEAMAARDRPTYGVQFHPEVSGAHGRRLLANFVGLAKTLAPGAAGGITDE